MSIMIILIANIACLLLLTQLSTLLINPSAALTTFDSLNVHALLSSSLHPNPKPSAAGPTRNLSLQVHRRDSIFPGHPRRISDLLRRDLRRVASLHRLLSPSKPDSQVSDLSSSSSSGIFSGLEQGSGEFLVRIGVGTPPVDQLLVVDSGSDVIWLQCQPCSQCYPQPDPLFDPARSSSFSPLPCTSPTCDLLPAAGRPCDGADGRCEYRVSYADGSYTGGTLALETLTFGGGGGGGGVGGVAIGCGRRNGGLFVGADGLLGLGWGPLSFVGQLGGLAGGSFAYCLPSLGGAGAGGGEMVFGRSEAVRVGSAWVPLVRNPLAPSLYYVMLTGLGVGGVRLEEEVFELGGAVVDTGTVITRLPSAAYVALREGFVGATGGLPRMVSTLILDTCYALGGYGSVRVPTVTLYFEGGTELTLPARNLLIPVDGDGTFCFAFAPSPSHYSGLTILGNILLQGIRITVDSANGFLGFGPDTC